MTSLDKIKERLNYLRLWLGIIVATLVSICGWLANNIDSGKYLILIIATIIVILMSVAVYYLNKLINQIIESIGN